MRKKIFSENKKGVSAMVSYVLLVVFLIIISGLVYQWLRTYIPKDSLECPDGSSLFIKEANFDSQDARLEITIKNNGRFNLAGYFIYMTNDPNQELPTIELSNYLDSDDLNPGFIFGNSILFEEGGSNLFLPGDEDTYFFDIPGQELGEPYSIEIIPTRFQEIKETTRFVSCGNARSNILVNIQ